MGVEVAARDCRSIYGGQGCPEVPRAPSICSPRYFIALLVAIRCATAGRGALLALRAEPAPSGVAATRVPSRSTSVLERPAGRRAPLDAVGRLRRPPQPAAESLGSRTSTRRAAARRSTRSRPTSRRCASRSTTPSATCRRRSSACRSRGGRAPPAGTDRHMVVWQPSTDTMWEFWIARQHVRRLARALRRPDDGRVDEPGHYTDPNPAGARRRRACRCSAASCASTSSRRAGSTTRSRSRCRRSRRARSRGRPSAPTASSQPRNAIPEGTRFRIDPSLDLDTIPMSPLVRTMAVAAQRYGIVVRDGAGAVAFYGEDPTPTGRNPFLGPPGCSAGGTSRTAAREFPWEHLQALKTHMTFERSPLCRSAQRSAGRGRARAARPTSPRRSRPRRGAAPPPHPSPQLGVRQQADERVREQVRRARAGRAAR